MGYNSVEQTERDADVEFVSLSEVFEKACPIFMSYGMTYDEFWYDDLYKTKYHLQAYRLKLKHEDELLWEQGMYIYEAILDCSPILHPFSKAKKPLPYAKQPYLMKLEEEQAEATKQQVENERLKAQIWLQNWVRAMNRNNEKEG